MQDPLHAECIPCKCKCKAVVPIVVVSIDFLRSRRAPATPRGEAHTLPSPQGARETPPPYLRIQTSIVVHDLCIALDYSEERISCSTPVIDGVIPKELIIDRNRYHTLCAPILGLFVKKDRYTFSDGVPNSGHLPAMLLDRADRVT